VSRGYLAADPSRGPLPERQWLAAVVFVVFAELATLALLRSWPLPVLAAAATGLVMALGDA